MIDDRTADAARVAAPDAVMAPNAGAHRLLHWTMGEDAGDFDKRLYRLAAHGINDATYDRLIDGSLVPFEETADAIARATAGAVLPDDWKAPGAVWDVLPAERAA
ncbi:hypothetical protein [Sphingomonas ginsenosidimutans]|jgi:hypothetical protein|uniref:hypothetical protein n=1 Tax=Sphingomonas ginsenosidimutans TaxID=862134 RepID=UPI001D7B54BE|nr:hypothetical protein [Sphingomonas ginsenosidimutans]MBY0301263.1 hypothetical protein [Sphingomonas ginsenosidimutans]